MVLIKKSFKNYKFLCTQLHHEKNMQQKIEEICAVTPFLELSQQTAFSTFRGIQRTTLTIGIAVHPVKPLKNP